ncbi:MAG: adenosine deaminase [Clostridium sp.]
MNKNGCYIDLHAHLDGSVTVDIAKKLAVLQNIALPADNDEELLTLLSVPDSCESLNDFLQCFDLPGRLMQTPEGLQNAVTLVLENMALDGVIYAELRFAPQFHTLGGMTQEQAVQAAVAGLKNAPIPGNLILCCCMRGEGNEKANEETLALAKKYLVKDHGVTAMDLAGAEALFPTVNYLGLFEEAKAAGIPYTVHAGEADGPESVRAAIQTGTKRIGHGVRSMEDEAVMELIREKGITLEMCPTSNRQTHAIPDMKQYPLVRFLESGIRVTVSPRMIWALSAPVLSKEFDYLKREFGLTEEQQKQVVLNAADAAFASEETKKMLREKIFESLWSVLMINREDMLELTRRMTPARSSVGRIAGAYFDEEGYVDGTFNTNF